MSDTSENQVARWKSHPDYSEGYGDAFAGEPRWRERDDSEPYGVGYEAGLRAVALFEQHGFKRNRSGFEVELCG